MSLSERLRNLDEYGEPEVVPVIGYDKEVSGYLPNPFFTGKPVMSFTAAGRTRQYPLKRYAQTRAGRIATARKRQRALIRAGKRALPVTRFRRRQNWRTGGFMGQELKFYDQHLSLTAVPSPADSTGGELDPSATICLNSVTQGDGEQQRDGRKITMKSIMVEGNVRVAYQTAQTTGDNATIVYIALVLDTQTNGAQLNSEDVFTNPSADATLAPSCFRNLQYTERFRVLGSRKLTLENPAIANNTNATGNITQQGLAQAFRMYIPLGDLVTTYSGTTETVANITDNSLHIIAFSSNTGLVPQLEYNCRLRFMG